MMTTRAKPPMWRWQRCSLPRDERTGEVSKAIMSKATRTGRSEYGEEMWLRFRCEVGKKRWEAAVLVNNVVQAVGGYVSPHVELGLQKRAGPNGLWIVTTDERGIVYSGDAYEFAQELVVTEQAGPPQSEDPIADVFSPQWLPTLW